MKRSIQTYQHSPIAHVVESETVDFDNRNMSFTVFGEEDPHLVTVKLDGYVRTLSRAAHVEGLERLIQAIKTVPSQPKGSL
jgi:hypothetical protein